MATLVSNGRGGLIRPTDSTTSLAKKVECVCYRQAETCPDENNETEPINFYALPEDIGEENLTKSWVKDGCYVRWGGLTPCLEEDAHVADSEELDAIEYVDECDGFRQAYDCTDNSPIDGEWYQSSQISDANLGKFFRVGETCAKFGPKVACLPPGVEASAPPAEYFDTCACTEGPPAPCVIEAVEGGDLNITVTGVTPCFSVDACFADILKFTSIPPLNGAWTVPVPPFGTAVLHHFDVTGNWGTWWTTISAPCVGGTFITINKVEISILISRSSLGELGVFLQSIATASGSGGAFRIFSFTLGCVDDELAVTSGNDIFCHDPEDPSSIAEGGNVTAELA